MQWKNRRVIVTGGAGVIGQELIGRLLDRGATVKCYDIVELPTDLLNKTNFQLVDVSNLQSDEFQSFEPDILFHLAASFGRTKEYPEFWPENFVNNVKATHHLIDLAKDYSPLEKFVFASSYLVYAPSLYLSTEKPSAATRLKENDLIDPRNLTGLAKYYAEKELEMASAFDEYDFVPISARIFRVYGRGSRDIIGRWIRAALNNTPIAIYGRQNAFDYIHADDVAEGLIQLAEADEAEGPVNLGSGESRLISEVIDILSDLFPDIKLEDGKGPENGFFEASSADISKLKSTTAWSPQIDLRSGMEEIAEFEKMHNEMETHKNPYRTHRAYKNLRR